MRSVMPGTSLLRRSSMLALGALALALGACGGDDSEQAETTPVPLTSQQAEPATPAPTPTAEEFAASIREQASGNSQASKAVEALQDADIKITSAASAGTKKQVTLGVGATFVIFMDSVDGAKERLKTIESGLADTRGAKAERLGSRIYVLGGTGRVTSKDERTYTRVTRIIDDAL